MRSSIPTEVLDELVALDEAGEELPPFFAFFYRGRNARAAAAGHAAERAWWGAGLEDFFEKGKVGKDGCTYEWRFEDAELPLDALDWYAQELLWRAIADGGSLNEKNLSEEELRDMLFVGCGSGGEEEEVVRRAAAAEEGVLSWLKDPKIVVEQQRRAAAIRWTWQEEQEAEKDSGKKKKLRRGAEDGEELGVGLGNEETTLSTEAIHPIVERYLTKRMKLRHTLKGLNALRRAGLVNVESRGLTIKVRGSRHVFHGPGGCATLDLRGGKCPLAPASFLKKMVSILEVCGSAGEAGKAAQAEVVRGAAEACGLEPMEDRVVVGV